LLAAQTVFEVHRSGAERVPDLLLRVESTETCPATMSLTGARCVLSAAEGHRARSHFDTRSIEATLPFGRRGRQHRR
jgi:hypothetical protein